MPRTARIKSSDSIYHIMVRSISDTSLYKDDFDKDKFLELVKKYQDIFAFKVYAYCIMDNHAHMIIDVLGADISSIMHGINQSYAQYFNRKHNRRGHLFQDRFKSKIVDSDKYLITLSGYIHNNPSDIEYYKDNIHEFKYSSLGIYLGIRKDNLGLIDSGYIMSQFSKNKVNAKVDYLRFVSQCNNEKLKEDIEFKNDGSEYRSERRIINREYNPEGIKNLVSKCINCDIQLIQIQNMEKKNIYNALCALLMRGLCNMRERDICNYFGNISQSQVARLCDVGLNIVTKDENCRNIIQNYIYNNQIAN